MRILHALLVAAFTLCMVTVASAFARPPVGIDRGHQHSPPGHGWGSGGSKGAPGPIAGAGLPFLFAAGAYAVARWRRRDRD